MHKYLLPVTYCLSQIMSYSAGENQQGFTLIELLVVISIIGFIATVSLVAFRTVRMHSRDAARANNIATINRALALYLNESLTGYPTSGGECLSSGSGAGAVLVGAEVIVAAPADPLEPATTPQSAGCTVSSGYVSDCSGITKDSFCYYYSYAADAATYYVSYFLESSTNAGTAGINVMTAAGVQ